MGTFLVLKVPARVNRVLPSMHIGLAGFRLRKATLKAKVVRLLTFRGIIRFDNLVGPLLPRSKIYTPTANSRFKKCGIFRLESISSHPTFV